MNFGYLITKSFKPILFGFVIGVLTINAGSFLVYSQFQIEERKIREEIREVLLAVEQSFKYAIKDLNTIALLLSRTVDRDRSMIDFESEAEKLINRFPAINVLEIINNGIVTHIYPLEGNEEVLGYDLYQNTRVKLEMYNAAAKNEIYISGPVSLIENRLGIIGMLPFDVKDEKFKISVVIIYLDSFLSQTQISTFSDRYIFQFSKINLATGAEEFFIDTEHYHTIDWNEQEYVIIPEGKWKLYAHRISKNDFISYIIFLSLFTIIISISIGFLTFKLLQKPLELEELLKKRTLELFESREMFKKSTDLLSSVLDSPKEIVIYSLDKNLNYIAYNKNYKNLIHTYFGTKVAYGENILDIYPIQMTSEIKFQLLQTLEGKSLSKVQEIKNPENKISYWQNWYSPITNNNQEIIGLTVFSIDITDRVRAENEKTTLLTEIHHRVKNNLAIVSGLLQLQKIETKDHQLIAIFDQSINRIISIALVHELMYSNDDFSSVDVNSYLKKLIPAISDTMQNTTQNVQFNLEIEAYNLNINQAIPLGLLLNELITNSFKYAFAKKKNNCIEVILHVKDDIIYVTYLDNGIGYPKENFINPSSLGLSLVNAQLSQLDAEYSVDTENKFKLDFFFTSTGKGSHSNIN